MEYMYTFTTREAKQMTEIPDIDLILPCYNPTPGWEEIIEERLAELRKALSGRRVRAIVVNDGSEYRLAAGSFVRLEDRIHDILVLSYPHNMGKGFAIRAGVQRSLAPVIVYTDVDFPYATKSMVNVISPVLAGEADIAIAVRNRTYYNQLPLLRRWMSHFLRLANKYFLRLHTSDTQGGLKAFSGPLRETFLQTKINRYLFDLEFIYLTSRKSEIRVKAVEADLRDGIVMSPVRLGIIFDESWNFLKVLITRKR
jgi:glycosyltransferase involved in cell wall biosynthesis